MGSMYAADGSWRITLVDGSTYTGLIAKDSSINCIPSTISPSDVEGGEHKCGALVITTATPNTVVPLRAANGSLNIQVAPYTSSGAQRVTVVSAGGGGGGPATQVLVPPLLVNTSTFNPVIVASHKVIFPPLVTNTNTFFAPTITSPLPPPSYHASAVHFDGVTQIRITSLNAPNSQIFAYSVWVKILTGEPRQCVIWSSDPAVNGSCWAQFLNPSKFLTTYWKDELTAKKNPACTATNSVNLYDGHWHHILFCGHSDQASVSNNRRALYIDDVKVNPLTVTSAGHGVFNILISSQPFYVGSDGPDNNFLLGDMADFWFAVGTDLISGGPLGGGDIPVATRRLFIDAFGRPANPSGFPAGAIKFSGNASTFFNNQGTGGGFTVVSGALTNASTSPSD